MVHRLIEMERAHLGVKQRRHLGVAKGSVKARSAKRALTSRRSHLFNKNANGSRWVPTRESFLADIQGRDHGVGRGTLITVRTFGFFALDKLNLKRLHGRLSKRGERALSS
jgi:hypothetical protein